MKSYNRKILITPFLSDELKNRLLHIDNGIQNDILIPEDKSFNVSYNRDTYKKVTRFIDFLKYSSNDEINNYFNTNNEIKKLDDIYSNLKSYTPNNSYFTLVFYEAKGNIFKDNEYKLLYLLSLNKEINGNIKDDLNTCIEYKNEYIPTEKQTQIANYNGYNIVLGAAGTGKTDVAIHSYINSLSVNTIKNASIRDAVFITYSNKLSDYVSYAIDLFWNDNKNQIRKNVYTNIDFFIEILKENNINIDGYKLINNNYIKNDTKDNKLESNIANFNTFINWNFEGLNKSYLPKLNEMINKYGIDYPYLFYRGIFKGKIINKVSDNEIEMHFISNNNLSAAEFKSIRNLFDDYVINSDDINSRDEFELWYNKSIKRYQIEFKNVPSRYKNIDNFYELFISYFDFVNPIRNNKKYIDYLDLFKREALLIEGYRGNTRSDFIDEINVLYEMSLAYQKYLDLNYLLDDNDLAYLVNINLDKILDKGIFKNIIIDEFQDMTERQIDTIVKLTLDGGISHIFGDFEQTINPTFLQMENIETIYLVNNIEDYEKQILSSSFRYSNAICKELEALRELGKKLFGTEDMKTYIPLVSNKTKEFETSGNLLLDINLGDEFVLDVIKAKNITNIMFIVSDLNSKNEFIKKFKCNPERVFTISESKGREEDFVICYKIVSAKSLEYENLFSFDVSYSRAMRIFYNQLYVGITRCKNNFLQIEDSNILKENTLKVLKNIIPELEKENIGLFKEELIEQKANFYFRAKDSFRNLDFNAVNDNLSFYSGTDFDNLKYATKLINDYLNNIDTKNELYELANQYKDKSKYDLARVIYIVLDNNYMLDLLNIRENINVSKYQDNDISNIIINNKNYISNSDIDIINKLGYFKRKEEYLLNKIKDIKSKEIH